MNYFIVDSINPYSAKCNKVALRFTNTATILDGLSLTAFVPNRVELTVGQENFIPAFVVSSIVYGGYSTAKLVKSLQQQARAKAKPGLKIAAAQQVEAVFRTRMAEVLEAVKVEEANKEPIGEYAGTVGETQEFIIEKIEEVYSNDVTFGGWRHNGHGWEHPHGTCTLLRLFTTDGKLLMVRTYSVKRVVERLDDSTLPVTIRAKVTSQEVYRGERQTWIRIEKIL